MAKGVGFTGIVAVKRNPNAWGGAAVAAGALDGIWVNSITGSASTEVIESEEIQGRATQVEGDNGNLVVGVPLAAPLWYEGLEPLLGHFFCLAGAPTTLDTSAKQHTFKLKDQMDGFFQTVAYEIIKDLKVNEFDFVKWNKLTLRVSPGRATIEMEGIGFSFSDASAINTTTTIDTVTMTANREAAQFRQLLVRTNAQGGAGLGAGDALHVSGFEITIERGLERDFTTEFGNKTSEPLPAAGTAGATKVSGSFAFSNLISGGTGQNAQLVAEQIAGTLRKADITLTADTLAGAATQKFQHILYLPKIKLEAAQKPGLTGLGRLGWTVPFKAHHVGAIPTGFPAGFIDAITWVNISKRTTDALA